MENGNARPCCRFRRHAEGRRQGTTINYILIVYIVDGSTTTGWRRQYLETLRLAKNWPRLRVHRMDQMVSCTIANKRK